MTAPRRFADRVGDATDNQPPPPLVLRRGLHMFWIACCLGVIYGTVGPIGLNDRPWLAATERWSLALPSGGISLNDLYTNFMVFLPVGIGLRLIYRRRGRAPQIDFLLTVATAAALSYTVEFAQQFMPARTASWIDVAVNTLSATCAALVAPLLLSRARLSHAKLAELGRTTPWFVAAWLVGLYIIFVMTQPLAPKWPQWPEWRFAAIDALDLSRAGAFALFAMLHCLHGMLAGRGVWRSWAQSTALATGLALGLEAAQIVLREHVPSLTEALVASVGGLLGPVAAVAIFLQRYDQQERQLDLRLFNPLQWRPATIALLSLTCVVVLVTELRHTAGPAAPFDQHFRISFDAALADLLQRGSLLLLAALLTFVITPDRGRSLSAVLLLSMVLFEAGVSLAWRQQMPHFDFWLLAAGAWLAAAWSGRVVLPAIMHPPAPAPIRAAYR